MNEKRGLPHITPLFGFIRKWHAIALLLLLVIFNIRSIERYVLSIIVFASESHFMSEAQKKSVRRSEVKAPFQYFRLAAGNRLAQKRWIVYDESGQVKLDYKIRSREWWQVTKEFEEGEACMTNGLKLYSNFYVQYSFCN